MEVNLSSSLTDAPDVEIADVEKVLSQFWNSPQGKEHVRAGLFNLIVYTEGEKGLEKVSELTQNIIAAFPCRIIFINQDLSPEKNYLKVTASTIPGEQGFGNTLIYCDQIHISASQKHQERIIFLLLPHLVPDLPTYLLWAALPDEKSHTFNSLCKYSERLIVQSTCISNFEHFSKKNACPNATLRHSLYRYYLGPACKMA